MDWSVISGKTIDHVEEHHWDLYGEEDCIAPIVRFYFTDGTHFDVTTEDIHDTMPSEIYFVPTNRDKFVDTGDPEDGQWVSR